MTMASFLSAINKQYDAQLIKLINEVKTIHFHTPKISTGCMSLDDILKGGWPLGKQIELSGNEKSGKTTLLLHTIASLLKNDTKSNILYFDLERRVDWEWADIIGVGRDNKNLYVFEPEQKTISNNKKLPIVTMEEVLDIVKIALSNNKNLFKLIIIDSIPGLIPRKVLNGEVGDAHMAEQARLFSQYLPIIQNLLAAKDATIIWVNQLRVNIDIHHPNPKFMPKTKTPGGKAKDFWYSTRVELRESTKIKKENYVEGVTIKYKVTKSSHGGAYGEGEFNIYFNRGICSVKESIYEPCLLAGIIVKNHAMFSLPGLEKAIRGVENTINYIIENEDVKIKLQKLLEEYNENTRNKKN